MISLANFVGSFSCHNRNKFANRHSCSVNNGEDETRRILTAVVNRLLSRLHFRIFPQAMPGIRVPVGPWEIAARNFDPDLVVLFEDVTD